MRNEPHPESKWTHPICDRCYHNKGGAVPPVIPMRINTLGQAIGVIELCCWCGKGTVDGIYLREDPSEVHPV